MSTDATKQAAALSTPNLPFLAKLLTDQIVGIVIRKGGASKRQDNANLVISVSKAIIQGETGDVQGAMASIDALIAKTKDPAAIAEIQGVVQWVTIKAQALINIAQGSAIGTLVEGLLTAAANEAITVATQYLPAS